MFLSVVLISLRTCYDDELNVDRQVLFFGKVHDITNRNNTLKIVVVASTIRITNENKSVVQPNGWMDA